MPITLFEGPNLSGRSAALRSLAWERGVPGRGCYLHPALTPNSSGLARTVGGEIYVQGLMRENTPPEVWELSAGLDLELPLAALSGGQQARLNLACGLAGRPERFAIDGVLEQLDPDWRRVVIGTLLKASGQVALSDNNGRDLQAAERQSFARSAETPDLNAALVEVAGELEGTAVQAPNLALHDLTFRYGRASEPIFEHISFVFESGRAHVLKAPNGSGKSTLARLLAGVLKPTGGEILVDDRPHQPHRSSANLIFTSFQNPLDQIFGRSGSEYLDRLHSVARARASFLRSPLGLTPERLIEISGLASFALREPFDLPPVVCKRMSILAALLSRSPWLFFDEPSLGSDLEGRRGLARLFDILCRTGFGVVIVTHSDEFDHLADVRHLTIAERTLVLRGTT